MKEREPGEYLFMAMQYANAIPSCCTRSQYDYKEILSRELCREKLIPCAHVPLKIILLS